MALQTIFLPATGASKQHIATDRQLLQDPLPPPEHIQQDHSCWYDTEQPSSSSSTHQAGSTYAPEAPNSGVFQHNSGRGGSMYSAGYQPPTKVHAGDSMRTSATGQSAGSSLITTAHSPSMQWQSALERLRQLQQRTEEAFMQGDQIGR